MSSIHQLDNRAGISTVNTAAVNIAETDTVSFWGKDGFTFGDVLDIFNPLHHLPIISKYYREQTEDNACEGSRLIGGVLLGALLGGAAGVVSSVANSALRHETHQDISEHLLAVADESIDNLAQASSNQLTNNNVSTTTEDFLENAANGSLSAADGIQKNSQARPSQTAAIESNRETTNPFFAQILDEYSNEQPFDVSTAAQRSRDWGKV
ncbi:MAG: hypothetical protein KZQ64_08285 [gamma proteobacterium symbiont of Bathyaustriella thionipta]|nr:hypothetical protein [gamma proteobacterium symbiont of Bathyaustriella thionipta]MCU7950811.1 hypothetical protein [gamma proteobacterium symbiont of Bathyaustriella thionipta]MCU7953371.1 hypothetical protein [gamma proteobacterium symbiont of Bathyaustriella thionipta]MCU7957323.1 hypothetical protein [gamma proteobacterium symbiont of Bathyaustriella thionipta]MCU7967820.1 hypothetical protein [gamma proteobacterium symbiont of Bathyaustriella thionipta]